MATAPVASNEAFMKRTRGNLAQPRVIYSQWRSLEDDVQHEADNTTDTLSTKMLSSLRSPSNGFIEIRFDPKGTL